MISNLGDREKFHRVFILILALVVSAVFLYMIRGFIVTVLMAAIVSGLAYPLYRGFLRRVRGHGALAAVLTLLTLLVSSSFPWWPSWASWPRRRSPSASRSPPGCGTT